MTTTVWLANRLTPDCAASPVCVPYRTDVDSDTTAAYSRMEATARETVSKLVTRGIASTADDVARAVVAVVTAPTPPVRVTVGMGTWLVSAVLRYLPYCIQDKLAQA